MDVGPGRGELVEGGEVPGAAGLGPPGGVVAGEGVDHDVEGPPEVRRRLGDAGEVGGVVGVDEEHAVEAAGSRRVVHPGMVDLFTGEQAGEDVEALIEHPRPSAVVDLLAETAQLLAACVEAEADAEDHPAAGQLIDGDHLAGNDLRAPAGQRRHHRAELDPLGRHRDGRERDPRVGRRAGRSAVADVVPHEEPVPAGRVGG